METGTINPLMASRLRADPRFPLGEANVPPSSEHVQLSRTHVLTYRHFAFMTCENVKTSVRLSNKNSQGSRINLPGYYLRFKLLLLACL